MQVWAGEPAKSADQSLRIPVNHEEQEVSSGAIIEMEAGSRVTLVPGVYHEFYPVSDECIVGEVGLLLAARAQPMAFHLIPEEVSKWAAPRVL